MVVPRFARSLGTEAENLEATYELDKATARPEQEQKGRTRLKGVDRKILDFLKSLTPNPQKTIGPEGQSNRSK